jgi:hypothetical protein
MHGRTHGHLQGFQIPPPRLATGAKGNAQQLFYFARDFLLDRFDRLFSLTDGEASSTGRISQICSLTFNSCSPSSRKRWHSATSRWALAKPAGEENVSVTVCHSPCVSIDSRDRGRDHRPDGNDSLDFHNDHLFR